MDDLLPVALPFVDRPASESEESHERAPASAEEYLRRVRSEVRNCPSVVVADFNRETLRSKQTVIVSNSTGFTPAPRGYAPCLEWQRQQAATFSELRQSLFRTKAKIVAENKKKMDLPKYKDEDSWCQFCLGQPFLDRIRKKQGRPAVSDDKEELCEQLSASTPIPPLISVVSILDQAMVQHLLEYHVEWIEQVGFSVSQGCWIFALLACLEKPLLADATATLRILARHCATLRAVMATNKEEQLPSLNLLISIISRYFDQTDLADSG